MANPGVIAGKRVAAIASIAVPVNSINSNARNRNRSEGQPSSGARRRRNVIDATVPPDAFATL